MTDDKKKTLSDVAAEIAERLKLAKASGPYCIEFNTKFGGVMLDSVKVYEKRSIDR